MHSIEENALAYLKAGLSVLPAHDTKKYAALKEWGTYKERLPTEHELIAWLKNGCNRICIVLGEVSGHAEALDFDCEGEKFDAWRTLLVSQGHEELIQKLVIERTPGKGFHTFHRCEGEVGRSTKLAQRKVIVAGSDEVFYRGKNYKPRKDENGQWAIYPTLIETKGEGGLILCAPSPGYELVQGDFTDLPMLTSEEREILLQAAWSLNEHVPDVIDGNLPRSSNTEGDRPGDEFNRSADISDLLESHEWVRTKGGENEYWRRPGKPQGTSATLKDGVFYVFSSNAPPFEPDRGYSLFAVYSLLEHNGVYAAAASALRDQGFGSVAPQQDKVDITGILNQAKSNTEFEEREKDVEELMDLYPKLRTPVIHGLLRQGETMNVVSAPKIGKSWLVNHLAISVATGGQWLGFDCEQSDVLVIDNELHPESSIYRLVKVANGLGINIRDVKNKIRFRNLRGKLRDLISLGPYLQSIPPGKYKVIILDAFYRFLPQGMDENDNGTMANLYNYIDSYADHLQCSFVIIHHTSKGNQSMKDITDVGAGAGSQSRATDAHLVLRRHEEDDVVSLDAVVRSWPPPESRCLRWSFPIWVPADDLDPGDLKQQGGKKKAEKVSGKTDEPEEQFWEPKSFVESFISETPVSKARIQYEAEKVGLSTHRVGRYLNLAEEMELIFRWKIQPGKLLGYATVRPPEELPKDDRRELVEALLEEEPDLSLAKIGKRCGVSKQYVHKVKEQSK